MGIRKGTNACYIIQRRKPPLPWPLLRPGVALSGGGGTRRRFIFMELYKASIGGAVVECEYAELKHLPHLTPVIRPDGEEDFSTDNGHYKLLPDGSVEPMYLLLEWSDYFEHGDRCVAFDLIKSGNEEILVSTIFLGLDMNMDAGLPTLFETGTFYYITGKDKRERSSLDDPELWHRYSTKEEALAGHELILERVKKLYPVD